MVFSMEAARLEFATVIAVKTLKDLICFGKLYYYKDLNLITNDRLSKETKHFQFKNSECLAIAH